MEVLKQKRILRLFLIGLMFCGSILAGTARAEINILGSWATGTTHAKESGTNRALVFVAHAKGLGNTVTLNTVTYGTRPMTKVVERRQGAPLASRVYVAVFILNEADIVAADSDGNFNVTWSTAPTYTTYTSVFLSGVNQTTLTGDTGNNGVTGGTSVSTPALATIAGDMVIEDAAGSVSGTYTVTTGWTKDVDFGSANPDGMDGHKPATGANEIPSVTSSASGTHALVGFVVKVASQASSPSPANAATNVAVTTDLGWTTGSGATSHDVYFGTVNPPSAGQFQGNQAGTTFDTGTMSYNTTYYWRIDEKNAGGTAQGDVWSFTTNALVPDVVNMTQAAASTAITGAGLVVGIVTNEYSDTVALGLVISQSPIGGTEVSCGSSVDMVVSLGKPVVPNVVGMTQEDANTAIIAVDNLQVGTVTQAYSDTVAAGLVISQSPIGGTEVNIGSSVDMVISLGKPVVPNTVRIMPLGDSITRGWLGSAYSWGYRKPLYDSLTGGGYDFDFVGSKADGSFPDPNHEGRDGWKADEILYGRPSVPAEGKLADWLNTDQPDVVLLHIGTNDITWGDENAGEVSDILDVIDAYEVANNKDVTVILALIINRNPYNYATTQFNGDVNNMALNRIANGDDIIIVDMESALNYSTDMYDNVHPNDNGYAKMANVWRSALVGYFSRFDCTISGYVLEPDVNTPVEGVLIQTDDNDINSVTDANGYYQLTVNYGWSGVATPHKEGYVFEPNGYIYTDVNQDYNDMNYIVTMRTFKIAGFVFEQDYVTPMSDVNVSAENGGGQYTSRHGGGSDITDANGYYEVVVDYNWSGTVMPGKIHYTFNPNSRLYTNVVVDQNNQGYTGTLLTYRITGHITNPCDVPIAGVLVSASSGGNSDITDNNGNYEVWVDYNWSGTVTPSKANYTSNPADRTYTAVLGDQTGQDYVVTNIYDLDCNGSIGFGDIAIMSESWLMDGPITKGNFNGDDIINFLDFADFANVWGD
jgi:hypothetical protein